MESRRRSSVLVAGAFAVVASAAVAAAAPPTATKLRDANTALAAKARSATLSLYGIESQLARARVRLAALHAQQLRLEREQASIRLQLRIAQRVVRASQAHLALRLRTMYEQGSNDPLAVILGAESIDEAVSKLDALDRAADQNRDVIRQALSARAQLRALTHKLAQEQQQVSAASVITVAHAAPGPPRRGMSTRLRPTLMTSMSPANSRLRRPRSRAMRKCVSP